MENESVNRVIAIKSIIFFFLKNILINHILGSGSDRGMWESDTLAQLVQ